MKEITLLGVKIHDTSLPEALDSIFQEIENKSQSFAVTLNPEFFVLARRDNEFRDILNSAFLSAPDGVGVLFAARVFGKKIRGRITGNDLVREISRTAEARGYSIYFFGGRDDAAERASEALKKDFPRLSVCGAQGGVFVDANGSVSSGILEKINEKKPDILFVALGQGKQERFIFSSLKKMPSVKFAMGVGGVFDFLSGRVRRAPFWMRKIGLEWLFRVLREPWRWKRIMRAVIVFPFFVVRERFFKRSES